MSIRNDINDGLTQGGYNVEVDVLRAGHGFGVLRYGHVEIYVEWQTINWQTYTDKYMYVSRGLTFMLALNFYNAIFCR